MSDLAPTVAARAAAECRLRCGEPDAADGDCKSANDELLLASRSLGQDLRQSDLALPTIHCGGCIQKIERALGGLAGVEQARVNLSTKRVTIRWRGEVPPPLIATLNAAGYAAHLTDVDG